MKNIILIYLIIVPVFTFGQDRINVNETNCGNDVLDYNKITVLKKKYWKELREKPHDSIPKFHGRMYYWQSFEIESDTLIETICNRKLTVNDELFTGTVFKLYPNGVLKYELIYKKGTPSKKPFIIYDEKGREFLQIRIKRKSKKSKMSSKIINQDYHKP